MGYQEQIAEWRMARRQEALKVKAEELRADHAEFIQDRDRAVANNDLGRAAEYDDAIMTLEAEWNQTFPPAPPRHAGWEAWCRQHKGWADRYGARGRAAIEGVFAYMQRPRRPIG